MDNLDSIDYTELLTVDPNTLQPTYSFDSLSDYTISPTDDLEYLNKPPTLDEVETSYEFDVNLPGEQSGKGTWIYSADLKKVFIKMKQIFTISISYTNPSLKLIPLFLRISPIFTEPEEQQNAVKRCLNHPTNDSQKPHILWCNHQSAQYQGDLEKVNYIERLSILVPLGSNLYKVNESIGFEFHCQNSCSSGINRRSTAMVFALETEKREVLGKRIMHFKVCSCPKRDKEKEEEALKLKTGGSVPKRFKRERDTSPSTSRKKPSKIIIKQELPFSSDEHVNIEGINGQIRLPNKQMLQKVYEYASSIVADAMIDNPGHASLLEPFRNQLRLQAYDQQQQLPDSQGSV